MNGDLSGGGDGIISDAQVYGNILHDNNKAAGLNMDGLKNPVVYNNLIYNNHSAQGIALFREDGAIVTSGAKIYNNTIIVPSDGRWGILVKNGANVNTKIYNNIIINQHAWRGCIATENTSQFESDYNILSDKMSANGDDSVITLAAWQNLGFDNHSQLAGTLASIFTNTGANNYQLVTNSQAIDAGTNTVSSIVTIDLNGHVRPAGAGFDVGAYEANSTLSIDDVSLIGLKVFPNPTSDYFSLSYDNIQTTIKSIDLFDINGRLVKSFTNKQQLDVQAIAKGVYFLKIQLTDHSQFQKKVIKK